jgi:uncharacterized repeat protein (TIGR03806 family)
MSRFLAWITAFCPAVCLAAEPARPLTPADRILWTDSKVVGSPEPPSPYRTQRVFEKLPLSQPVYLAAEPGTNNYLVAELSGSGTGPGRIRRFSNRPEIAEIENVLDINYLIYGFCFHPRFVENGSIYLMANGPMSEPQHKQNRIVRYTIDRQTHAIDPKSEFVILEWESNGHNGGELGFGPDGMLYCPTGDGTSDSDTLQTGQGLDDLLAVVIRIDVDHLEPGKPYSIPKDNPFLNVPGARPEIWAFGFRNPWRMTFDRQTGGLWVCQNGQDLWEPAYLVQRGGNYGWSVREGSHPFYLERKAGPGPILPPTVEHHHSEARSLTGGVVYYGSELPDLHGVYVYGDYSTGKIWGVKVDAQGQVTWHQELVDTPFAIVGFAEGLNGELFVIDQGTGVYKLEPRPAETPQPKFPTRLSETGLFISVKDHQVHPALIPYSVNAPLWSDGAYKERYVAVPGKAQIEGLPGAKAWNPPEGTVLVKTFSLELEAGNPQSRRRIETRLITKQQKEWVGYSYIWNDAQTDAELVDKAGKDVVVTIADAAAPGGRREQTWHYPSRAECMVCHSRAATFVLGLQTEQMNRDHEYRGSVRNQLDTLSQLGILKTGENTSALPKPASELPKFADPYDPSQPLESRVRAYLHVNCSTCHQAAGGGNAAMELEHTKSLAQMMIVDETPKHDKFGVQDAKLVAPGEPQRSILLHRISIRGKGQMPPLATALVDDPAVAMLREWITQLSAKSE